jgi:hypothetical protein
MPVSPHHDPFHHFIPQISTGGVYGAEEKLVKPALTLSDLKASQHQTAIGTGEILPYLHCKLTS